ncbi:DUF389 domain-containing protein [Halococcus sediminicola]|uniref:DUF389 domain-containing protein n=1 Tax=Halococcus sediminicola TaxID=1264579 RepID=UPI0009ADCA97|nr:DUF389 domain-containing protein [Halococcus sediminicola]
MNTIRLRVAEENREAVFDALNERDIDFVTVPTEDDESIVEAPVPTDALGEVLDATREAGLDDDYIVVLNAINTATPHMEELQDRYANDYDPLRLPELRSKARDFGSDPGSFGVMVFLSAAIAAIGLLVDSPAIVVGSMVIAPLVGPVLTAAVGAIAGDRVMFADSIRMQALGVVAAIVGAFVTALGLQISGLVPAPVAISSIELIGLRMAPTPLSVLVGFAAGIAAAVGLTTKGTKSLIGVLIAAALVPAAAAAGIGAAYGAPRVAIGSAGLLIGTMAAVDIGMYATLHVLYRSRGLNAALLTDRDLSRAAAVTVAIIVLGAAVAGYTVVEQTTFQRTVAQETADTLNEPAYTNLSLVSLRYQYGGPLWLHGSPNVTVTVTQPPNGSYPELPDRLTNRIADATSRNVTVHVQFQSTGKPEATPESNVTARLRPTSEDSVRS